MQIGDTVKLKAKQWKGWQATVIDDCYRKREDGICTVLVKINNKPTLEVELTTEDIE